MLVPQPRSIRALDGSAWIPQTVTPEHLIAALADPTRVPEPCRGWLDIRPTWARVAATPSQRQGYRLRIGQPSTPNMPSAVIEAETPDGARHGLATLIQLVRASDRSIPAIEVEDEPAFATRGVMLDVSRCRIPTMDHFREIIDQLAQLKCNHLQLYTEHTFAYAGHEEVWQGWSPMTPEEVVRLDSYCRGRGVELAANQNCFGHLASWLRRPKYAHLAETHGGWVFGCWPRWWPSSLCPSDPGSIRFVEDLLGQLLPCFTSPLVNVGCDETYDIAYGRSKEEVQRRGRVPVYLDFVRQIAEVARRHGKRPM